MAVEVAALLWWAGQALAQVPIALPAGEPAALWDPALRLAGLEVVDGTALITVSSDGGSWTLTAWDGDGTTRTATVPAPRSAADREAIALVASGLVRPVRPGSAPPPPPRPAPPSPLRPEPTELAAAPPPPEAVPVDPPPDPPTSPVGPVVDPGPVAEPPEEIAAPPEPAVPPAEVVTLAAATAPAALPAPGRRPVLAAPPVVARAGTALRPRTEPGISLGLRSPVGPLGPGELRTSIAATLPRSLVDLGVPARLWTLEVGGGWAVRAGPLATGPALGLRWHAIQAWGRTAGALVPFLGADLSATVLAGRQRSLALGVDLAWEPVAVEIVGPAGRRARVPPWEARAALGVAFGRAGDPNPLLATWSE